MKAQCPNCEAIYKIDDAKVPAKGAYAKCRKCETRFLVKREPRAQAESAQKDKITCPKCGHQQQPSDRCAECRIIFSKYDTAQQKMMEATQREPQQFDAYKKSDAPVTEKSDSEHAKPTIAELYFSLKGRVSLKTYWLNLVLPLVVVYFLAAAIDAHAELGGGLVIVVNLLVLWPSVAVSVKRWHDRDKSGLWVLINLVPIIGPLWSFIQTCILPGIRGTNRFGPQPA